MADEPEIYNVEPATPAGPPPSSTPAAGGSSMGSATPGKPGSVAPNAKIEAGGLLDDFDEDADFSDPGTGSPKGVSKRLPPVEEAASAWPPIVTDASVIPVLGSVRGLSIIGGAMLLMAVIVTAVATTSARPLIPPLIALYEGVVHTGTGVVAVLIAARFAERRVNRVELIAARMLVVVSIFLLIKNTNIPITGQIEEHVLAGGAYYLAVWGLFRLPRFETGLISGTHFCLWVLMLIGRLMYEVDLELATVAPTGG